MIRKVEKNETVKILDEIAALEARLAQLPRDQRLKVEAALEDQYAKPLDFREYSFTGMSAPEIIQERTSAFLKRRDFLRKVVELPILPEYKPRDYQPAQRPSLPPIEHVGHQSWLGADTGTASILVEQDDYSGFRLPRYIRGRKYKVPDYTRRRFHPDTFSADHIGYGIIDDTDSDFIDL